MQRACPSCTEMKQEYISNAHSFMDEQELAAIATPGKVRLLQDFDFDQVRPIDISSAVSMVLHHGH